MVFKILRTVRAKTCHNLAHERKAVSRMRKKERITLKVFLIWTTVRM